MSWTEDREIITAVYFTALNENNIQLFKIIKDNYDSLKSVYPLIEYVSERIDAVITLIANEHVWDSDILIRSALETLVKFVFIADAEESERPQLLNEFWSDLSEIYTVKISEQAKKNLKLTNESPIHRLAYTPLVISKEEEDRLRNKWPKNVRTRLEQKWSFTGIVNFISQKNKDNPMNSIEFLTQTYRMASHIAHGDEMGINIIRERNSRSEVEREAVHIGHYLRLLSECYYYSLLTSLYTMKYLKLDPKIFIDIEKTLKEIEPLVNQYQDIPFNDPIYDKFR